MALYLVQHGKSVPKEVDPERGLSEEGASDVKRIAGVARGYGVVPESIEHSGKKRAVQTAELLAQILEPPGGTREGEGLKPLDDPTEAARRIGDGGGIMIVGHLPFLGRLVSFLTAGSADYDIFSFQNGGIVALERGEDRGWLIQWALMPHVGRLSGTGSAAV